MVAGKAAAARGGRWAPIRREGDRVVVDLRAGRGAVAGSGEALTPRQAEVLALVADGLANRAIAERLGTTEATVRVHVRQVLRKLGAASRTEAALLALDEAAWLQAELLVLRREAVARAASLDATLAHVTQRCAAIGGA